MGNTTTRRNLQVKTFEVLKLIFSRKKLRTFEKIKVEIEKYEKDYKNVPKGTPELWNFLTVSTEQRGNSLFIGKYVINTFRLKKKWIEISYFLGDLCVYHNSRPVNGLNSQKSINKYNPLL